MTPNIVSKDDRKKLNKTYCKWEKKKIAMKKTNEERWMQQKEQKLNSFQKVTYCTQSNSENK